MACVEIENLSFKYPGSLKKALDDINLTVNDGEVLLLCGQSGCSKTTLLRHLKPVLTPKGEKSGRVLFYGREAESLSMLEQAKSVGFVAQDVNNNIVTDKVWHELAFGLENIGCDREIMRLRLAEMASFFDLEKIFYNSVSELSGGQKQLLSLASVMVMQPGLLLLDEPTSQLDPIAAVDFLATVKRINREFGTTVIMSEHRIEEAMPIADKVAVMDSGKIICMDTPGETARYLYKINHPMHLAMPSAARITLENSGSKECAITVAQGKRFIEENYSERKNSDILNKRTAKGDADKIIEAKNICFKYTRDSENVLNDLCMDVNRGEIYCLLGGNGAGKSTLLSVLCKIRKPYRGKLKTDYKSAALLVQDPKCLFVKQSIREELEDTFKTLKLTETEKQKLDEAVKITETADILDMHPYDVSGGELQRAAVAKLLLCDSEVLLLDEPTKGMDDFYKRKFGELMLKLKEMGKTIIIASHDIEFCAEYADKCALLFMGDITTQNEPHEFFAGNNFYTTAANRIARSVFKYALTPKEVFEYCNLKK